MPLKNTITNQETLCPKIIGHRGAPAYAPENTLASFKKVLELGAWAIECDVRRCKSGELVVMHDASIDRVAGVHGIIHDMTLNQLQSVKFKNGETVPTLDAVLDSLDAKINVILDLKEEGIADDIAELTKTYSATKGWCVDQFFATGFEHRELKKLHDLIPEIRIVPASAGTPHSLALFAQEMDAYAVCFVDFVFSQALFDDVRRRGLDAWVWISDERTENMQKFIDLGVDAIMINRPDFTLPT